jgi:CobQ/CobB/MinD/ParA nucleotide binding domain
MASSKQSDASLAANPTALFANLIGSNKGGVGKSFVCRIVYHAFLAEGLAVIPFDADTSTHDFSDIYDEVPESNILGFDIDEAIDCLNPVIDAVGQNRSHVLVNMPGNIDQIFERWFVTNNIAELMQENDFKMRIWYVVTGDYDSYMNLFVSLRKYGNFLSHVVVKNNISNRTNWQEFENNAELQDLIKKQGCPVIEIPYLHLSLEKMNSFRLRKLKWSQILDVQEQGFGIVERSRTKKFLLSCSDQIKSQRLIQV